MCNKCHTCFISLEVVTSGSQINLPSNKRIENGTVTSVYMRRAAGGTLKSNTGATIAADTVTATAHIFVKTIGGEGTGDQIPMQMFQRDYNSPEPLCVNWEKMSLSESRIQLDTTAAGYNAAHVFEVIFGLKCENCKL